MSIRQIKQFKFSIKCDRCDKELLTDLNAVGTEEALEEVSHATVMCNDPDCKVLKKEEPKA